MTTTEIPIVNPITFYLAEAARIAQEDIMSSTPWNKGTLAAAAGIAKQTIHKTQLGLYSSMPSKLVIFMSSNPVGEADHSITTWNTHYRNFLKYEMRQLKSNIEQGLIEAEALFTKPEDLVEHYPTFTDWRKSLSYSQIDFCKTFLLHQAIVSKYENGEMQYLPESIIDRLTFVGMSTPYIKALEKLPIAKKIRNG